MESGNDYLIQLKNNRLKLKLVILYYLKDKNVLSSWESLDRNKGRIDKREYKVYDLNECEYFGGWDNINSITIVKRHGIRNKKPYMNYSYYISNIIKNAEEMASGIRGHWSIENDLHRTKDVVQLEDKNYIKNMNLARNVSILQTLAMSIIRLFEGPSLKFANEKYANRIMRSFQLINSPLRI